MKVVQVLLLLFIVETSHTSDMSLTCPNVALRGKASQSSRFDFNYGAYSAAGNAIDGNREAHISLGSCSQTAVNVKPWWTVDLLENYEINSLHIVGRVNGESLEGAEIWIGKTKDHMEKVAELSGGVHNIYPLPLDNPVEGRYVTVMFQGIKALSLCEVEVYGCRGPGENQALFAKATQSSATDLRTAALANDGNRNCEASTCMQTRAEPHPWMRLDLGERHTISFVNVTNTCDDPERVSGTEIRIGDSLENEGNNNPRCAVIGEMGKGETQGFNCHRMKGRYVNLVIPKDEDVYLQLCEVEVYGSELD